jgi:hypothetical protein
MVEANNSIKFGDLNINYSINRTERNTVGIVVEPDGKVIVKAPFNLNEEKIKETVFKKRKWIEEKIKLVQDIKKPIPQKRELVSGEKIQLKNRLYRIKIQPSPSKRSKIFFYFKTLYIYIYEKLSTQKKEQEITRLLINWYRDRAKSIISQRLEKYTKYLDKKPQDISIRNIKLRWGSCTKEGILIFNWRIVMAPISAIDYVIVHELCHLKEPSHSNNFWNDVESLFPNYKKWKEWLRINGPSLDLRL